MPQLAALDHLVLTVSDIALTAAFYRDVLGMQVQTFTPADGSTRTALSFGVQKINLHPADRPFDPKAQRPQPGSADLCFLTETPLDDWQDHLMTQGVPVIEGPVARTGATGPLLSLYIRDPDGNLIEIAIPA
ncbi:Catechol 2,3-dioxygenase [Loktanella atrilutea]|uniref:Catechol 2,3-dioxygenase n=1 Tax=Loktanella atrilutea TaxID=366533 RepID=A0A1M4WQ03_LOKAT|nr:VOC family protein [Loktanella atrilutea]SHE83052.1 Catechol 2,3-dioxygenase [Loktanella atrilutea]